MDKTVSYEAFGAKGDGITNDIEAIRAAHEYANKNGIKVVAQPDAVYYIGRTGGKSVSIKTDVDWCGAKFIIDDRSFDVTEGAERGNHVFSIASDYPRQTFAEDDSEIGKKIAQFNREGVKLGSELKKLDLGLGYPAMVFLINDEHRVYIRYGENQDAGSSQRELVLLDKDGNISSETSILIDYEKLTGIEIVRDDVKPITVKGGNFVTLANAAPRKYTYYGRGIAVNRSHTTVSDITHSIEGEGETGAPYNGFIAVLYANDVTVKDCHLQAHRAYKLEGDDHNTMGSYDLIAGQANNVTWKNVTQSNFFLDDGVTPSVDHGYWGIMGSNYCKNLTYDGCKLTRFDAHCGTYNAAIINSEVGNLTLIGGGTFRIENSKIYAYMKSCLVMLRGDYGSTWRGRFILNDVTAVTAAQFNQSDFLLVNGSWVNHYFGYSCYMPEKIEVKNFKVTAPSVKTVCLAGGSIVSVGNVTAPSVNGEENRNPYVVTKELYVFDNAAGYEYTLPDAEQFADTMIAVK